MASSCLFLSSLRAFVASCQIKPQAAGCRLRNSFRPKAQSLKPKGIPHSSFIISSSLR